MEFIKAPAHFYLKEVGKIDVFTIGDYHIQLGHVYQFFTHLIF